MILRAAFVDPRLAVAGHQHRKPAKGKGNENERERKREERESEEYLFSLLASRLGPPASSYLAESLDRRESRMAAGKTTSSQLDVC